MQVAGGDVGHAASPKTSRHGSPQKQQVVIAHASGTPTLGQKTTEQADYCAAPCDTLILNGLLLLPKLHVIYSMMLEHKGCAVQHIVKHSLHLTSALPQGLLYDNPDMSVYRC